MKEEVIETLEKAEAELKDFCGPCEKAILPKEYIHKALALLKKPCPECGDLVKELRCAIKDYRKIYSRRLFPAAYKVVDKAEQAADRIEQLETENKYQAKSLEAYSLLEEMSPPDIPRPKFVQMIYDAWQENYHLKHRIEELEGK